MTAYFGYVFVLLTVVLNVSKGGVTKSVSTKIGSIAENVDLCFLRNFFCVLIGFFLILFTGTAFSLPTAGVLVCLFSGASMAVNYLVWIAALKTDAYMLASTANNAGFVVAALCGVFLFREKLTPYKFLAFALIAAAIFFMARYQTTHFTLPSRRNAFLLVTVFLTAGTNSVAQKLFTRTLPDASVHLFTFYTFVIACVILLFVRPFFKSGKTLSAQAKRFGALLPKILFMAAALYGATFFQTKATLYLDAVILYPLTSALNLIGACLMAWIVFSEKPSKDSVIGTCLVFFALILSRL